MSRILIAALTVTLVAGGVFAQDKDKATKSTEAESSRDMLADAIDPFVPGKERARFLKAAGVDTELDEAEFKANAKLDDGFIRAYDKWSNLMLFDKNKDKKIDWFEANAYRRAVRAAVVATYDKDGNKKLNDEEREKANKDLSAGKLPKISAPTASTSGNDSNLNNLPEPGRRTNPGTPNQRGNSGRSNRGGFGNFNREEFTKKYDKDGDGKLSDEERRDGFRTEMQARVQRFREENPERAAEMDKRREEFLKKYDKDGDGELSREERSAGFRAEGEARRAEFTKKHDKDGDGELSDEERRAGFRAEMEERLNQLRESNPELAKRMEERRAEFMKQYDKNGDGEIDQKEREAIRESFQGRFRGRRGGQRGRGDGQRSRPQPQDNN